MIKKMLSWLRSGTKKKQLLKLARSGAKRPGSQLGPALARYCAEPVYDPVFDKKMRELAPDWFK